MEEKAPSQKTAQQSSNTSSHSGSAGANGTAMMPPAYGMDMIDRGFEKIFLAFQYDEPTTNLATSGVVQLKSAINSPGDEYEQEADRIADYITSSDQQHNVLSDPKSFSGPTTTTHIQRQEKNKSTEVLSEGAFTAFEHLPAQPDEKNQLDALRFKLWDSQPDEYKAGMITFALGNAALLGSVFAMDQGFRSNTLELLEDKNLLLPLKLLSHHDRFVLSSFKYKFPSASSAPYTFETEFSFDAWLELMQKKWNTPKLGLDVKIDSAYGRGAGFSPLTGGSIKLKLGGGILNLGAFYKETLPATPMLISNPTAGEPPIWVMRSLPSQLNENLPRGSGVFLTVDVLRLPELFRPPSKPTTHTIQRKKNDGDRSAPSMTAGPLVQHELSTNQGVPLDRDIRQFMERRFNQDFSHVRIHTGSQAAESADSINARAYTSGSHIVFDQGEYQPDTQQGRKLLAHELVHVKQQTGVVQRQARMENAAIEEDKNLNYQDLERRKSGINKGIDIANTVDTDRLLKELQADHNFNDRHRLAILLSIAVQADLTREVTEKILVPKNGERQLKGAILSVIESYGFIASDGFKYQDDEPKSRRPDLTRSADEWYLPRSTGRWYVRNQTLFDKSGQRGTFDLRTFQDKHRFLGNMGGVRFDDNDTAHPGDRYYNETWLDEAVNAHAGSETLTANIRETTGKDRRGKIFVSIRDDIRQANIFASSLPIEGINLFKAGTLCRSGPGVVQGVQFHISWAKDTDERANTVKLQLDFDHLLLNQFELIWPTSTLAFGLITVTGLRIELSQNNLAASDGFLGLGLFKNGKFALDALTELFPNVLKLLSYVGLTMKEEFTGANERKNKDAFSEFIKQDFSGLNAAVSFTSLQVENIYDTTKGFLDKLKIEQLDKDNKPVRQRVDIQENIFWTTDALHNLKEKKDLINKKNNSAKASVDDIAELQRLNSDLDYIENHYYEVKKLIEESSDLKKWPEARRRMEDIESRYKSVNVELALRDIELQDGGYIGDLVNEALKSFGFVNPQMKGIEKFRIQAVDSYFSANSNGVARTLAKPGLSISRLHIPEIAATAIKLKTNKLLIKAGETLLKNVYVSVGIDFANNPLAKDPDKKSYALEVENLYVSEATLKGLTVKIGSADPLFDFPDKNPVEVWGLELDMYDLKEGNINLKIQDLKAQGTLGIKDEEKKTSTAARFGVDSTVGRGRRLEFVPVLDFHYNNQENSFTSKVDIRSSWVPSLAFHSPTLSIASAKDNTRSIQLDNLAAEVKVSFGKEKSAETPATPTVIEIQSLHLDKLSAWGINLIMKNEQHEDTGGSKTKPTAGTDQEVTLSPTDEVSIENIDVKGLRITVDDDATSLSTIEQGASVRLGPSNLSGIQYKAARGSVLKALVINKARFNELTLTALNRNGRQYTLKEFFRFFGRTRLAGPEIVGTYQDGEKGGTVGINGKSNLPISINYEESKDQQPGYYKIRLPLKRITLPHLDIETDKHIIHIPRAKTPATTSSLNDVDVQMRAYIEFNDKNEAKYDVYLDHLDIADLTVYGLEYHNKTMGITVVLEPEKPLHIPNVRAGGFHFSKQKTVEAFGKDGAWIKAAEKEGQSISAHLNKISLALSDGSFLAEKDATTGRSALDVDIASFEFKYDYDNAGNMTISLGKVTGGKMIIRQADKAENNIFLPDPEAIKFEKIEIFIDPERNKKRITLVRPTIKNVTFHRPSQTTASNHIKIVGDLVVQGNVELGDGNFDKLTFDDPNDAFDDPHDAFIGLVNDNIPVEIKNLHLEFPYSSKNGKDATDKPLTADQQKLLVLEQARDAAKAKMDITPINRDPINKNPDHKEAVEKYDAAVQAYEDQKTKIIHAAKGEASLMKKSLDAVIDGKLTVSLQVLDHKIPINIETYKGENYVEISTAVVDGLEPIISSIIKYNATNIPDNQISLLLSSMKLESNVLSEDGTLYGIVLKPNLMENWFKNLLFFPLCEKEYKHPYKDGFYNIYGIVEYWKYVGPSLVSQSGQADKKLFANNASLREINDAVKVLGYNPSERNIVDAVKVLNYIAHVRDINDAGKVLGNIIKLTLLDSFVRLAKVDVTADLSPQDVISTLLEVYDAGSLTFDKGKNTIDNIHVQKNQVGDPVLGTIGAGKQGKANILIPGATYITQDGETKVSYDTIEIAPVTLMPELNKKYTVENSTIKLNGLKFGYRKKK